MTLYLDLDNFVDDDWNVQTFGDKNVQISIFNEKFRFVRRALGENLLKNLNWNEKFASSMTIEKGSNLELDLELDNVD